MFIIEVFNDIALLIGLVDIQAALTCVCTIRISQ